MPTNTGEPACPVCGVTVTGHQKLPQGWDGNNYNCRNCGEYAISTNALECTNQLNDRARAILSAQICSAQNPARLFTVHTTHLKEAEKGDLADPAEQLDRLIMYVGERQTSPGAVIRFNFEHLTARLRALSLDDVGFTFRTALDTQLLDAADGSGRATMQHVHGIFALNCGLTMKGWKCFHELKRGQIHSRTAFMAMPFRNAEVARIVDEAFRPAVEETGFRLKRVDEEAPAGSIDDRIRVEIRLARFMIADLTGGNQGAYWEAGYAEGLGKPVIYTCCKAHFDKRGTHFDTNHRQTVVWDLAEPEKAKENLKATIRATLPFEAKMPPEQG